MQGIVHSVSSSPGHTFSKESQASIRLIAGWGVAGDAHSGKTVKHRSRVARDPNQPNLRQVHLIASELHRELETKGFPVTPGQMVRITTLGISLVELPTGTRLHLGNTAIVEVTGLRNPCQQLDGLQAGLMEATLDRDEQGNLIRKAGIMSVVIAGGEVYPGDMIRVEFPADPHTPLQTV